MVSAERRGAESPNQPRRNIYYYRLVKSNKLILLLAVSSCLCIQCPRWPTVVTHTPRPKNRGRCQALPRRGQEAIVAGPRDLRYGSSPNPTISDDPANTYGHFIWRWFGWCCRIGRMSYLWTLAVFDCVEHTEQVQSK